MEPERPTEKLLRAFARKRREGLGAPMEMHPSTRRALQAEVARQFRGKENRGILSMLTHFWPRFAWATVVVLVVGFGAVLWFGKRQARQPGLTMAKNESADSARQFLDSTSTSPAAGRTEVVAELDKRKETVLAQTKPENEKPSEEQGKGFAAGSVRSASEVALRAQTEKKLEVGPSVAPPAQRKEEGARGVLTLAESAASPPVDSEAFRRRYGLTRNSAANIQTNAAPESEALAFAQRRDELAAKNLAVTRSREAPALPAVTPPPALTASESRQAGGAAAGLAEPVKPSPTIEPVTGQKFAAVNQRVVQSKVEADTAPVNQPLTSFVVQQVGTELRIIDQDGSVYVGFARAPEVSGVTKEDKSAARALRAPATKLEQSTPPTASSNKGGSQILFFQVVGTNQTLKQKVVFTGNFWPRAGTGVSGLIPNKTAAFSDTVSAQSSFGENAAVRLSTTRIIGKVRIGTGSEIDIDAVPAHQ